MAFADGSIGQDLPRQYDDLNYDRVSQIGPAEGPAVADSATAGSISPGVHQCVVVFVTRQGFWTAPSPPISWTAAGSSKPNVTNIPTGPSNVVQRLLAFTGAGGANFYNVPATMTINDNTTTSLTVDFTDTILLSGTSMDYLFSQIELPEQLGVVAYAERLFWWGERAQMDNWRNLTFDGGWDASGSGRPLGWLLDPSFGAGGSREAERRGLGRRLSHHRRRRHRRARPDLAKRDHRRLRQSAAREQHRLFRARARQAAASGLTAGTLRINAFSPTHGQIGAGLAVTVAQATTAYQEFTAQLFGPQTSLPIRSHSARLRRRLRPRPPANPSWWTTSKFFSPTPRRIRRSCAASGTEEPEAYDGVTGIMSIAENNGQGMRAAFTLRNNLYFVKERSMYVTATDGVNEPALWQVEEVSNKVGTPSAHGVGIGEEWVVIAGRSGLYLFDGSEPAENLAGNSAHVGRDQLAVRPESLGAGGYAAQTHSRRRADGLGHAAESDSDARLHRRLRRSARRDAHRARALAQMGAVDDRREFLRPDRARQRRGANFLRLE